MNWFQQNRFLGFFLAVFGTATLVALFSVWSAKGGFDDAKARFDESANELSRLQHLAPFPSEANLKKMKAQAEDYGTELNKLKEELKTRVLPVKPMAPNEFQSRLRQAVVSLGEKAKANKVKLPDSFFLGFDEFSSTLPDTEAAPLLGQQLAQAELLVGILIESRVEAITAFRRVPPADANSANGAAAGARKPAPNASPTPSMVERNAIELSFLSSPGAARRIFNQIATNNQQFYIVRTLHVLNEKDKGPAREGAASSANSSTGANPSALNFIVGNERIQTAARIEMVRFAF